MKIDSHQHFWRLDRGDYHWLDPSMGVLYRDYLPDELQHHLTACGVNGTILVQAAQSEDETRFMLDLAREHDFIFGVVGWFDMDAEDAIERLDSLVKYGGGLLKGVRPMIQDMENTDWVLASHLDPVFDALSRRRLTFDALVRPEHVENIEKRLLRHPGLNAVIDHAGKPAIGNGLPVCWRRTLGSLAAKTAAYCKLSGLVTEMVEGATGRDLEDVTHDIIAMFGVNRVMWGSDWPVLNLASNYEEWTGMANDFCKDLVPAERQLIFGGNARRFYRLGSGAAA